MVGTRCCNLVYVYCCIASVAFCYIIKIIFSDEYLSENYLAALLTILAFVACCTVVVVESMYNIKVKTTSKGKAIYELVDSDLKSEDENEQKLGKECNWLMRKKIQFFHLIRTEKIYAAPASFGLIIILIGIFLKWLPSYMTSTVKKDIDYASIVMVVSGVFLEIMVMMIASSTEEKPVKRAYKPFDEIIKVPLKAFFPSALYHLLQNFIYVFSILFYQSSALYGLVTVNRMSEQEIEAFKSSTKLEGIHSLLFYAMVLANVAGIILLIENIRMAYDLAREDFLLIFEKNFRKNLVALDFFLPGGAYSTLEDLRDAYLEKSQRDDLSVEERRAVRYIEKPLYQTKRPFVFPEVKVDEIPEEIRPKETPM